MRAAGQYERLVRAEEAPEDSTFDVLESGKSSPNRLVGVHNELEISTGDLFAQRLREGNGRYSEKGSGTSGSCTFYTPLSKTPLSKARECKEPHHASHICLAKNKAAQEHDWADKELERVRREVSERARLSNWPARLQQVVVGDVMESRIAKTRLNMVRADGK